MTANRDREPLDAKALLGSAGIFFAALIFLLATIDRTSPLSFMPLSWHANRPLWYLAAFGGLLFGLAVLWSQRTRETPGQGPPSPCFDRVVLYTRRECPLCEEAKAVLAEYGPLLPPVEEIDIDTDPRLREQFDTCVPVAEFDGQVRFRGRINRVLLRRLIEAARSQRETGGTS